MTLFPSVRLRALSDKAKRAALQRLRDGHKAEDAAQEAMASYCRLKLAGRAFENTSAFVWRLGIHKAIDLIRREKRYRRLDEAAWGELADHRPSPRQQALAEMIGEITRAQLECLSEVEKTVFEMIIFQDRSRAEVAEITGLTPAAIGSVYYRAKLRLGFLERRHRGGRGHS